MRPGEGIHGDIALFCRVILHGRMITLRVFLQTWPSGRV